MPRGVPSTRRRNVFAHQRRHSATIGSQRDASSTTIHHRTFANMFAHQTMMTERDDIAMQHTRRIYCGRRVIEAERSADRPNRGANATRSPRCRPCSGRERAPSVGHGAGMAANPRYNGPISLSSRAVQNFPVLCKHPRSVSTQPSRGTNIDKVGIIHFLIQGHRDPNAISAGWSRSLVLTSEIQCQMERACPNYS